MWHQAQGGCVCVAVHSSSFLLPPELDRLVRLHVTDAPEEEKRGRRGRWLCAVKYSSFWQDQWSETCSYRKHSRHGRPGLKTASIIEVSGRYQFIQGQRGGFPFVHLSGLRRRRVSTCSRCSDGRRRLGFVCGFFAFLLLLLLLLELGCRTVRGLTSANSEFSP